jgi:tRNA-splicing ligase RtcB
MSQFDVIGGAPLPIKAWTRGVPVEDAALQQLRNVASLPFVFKHVAAMPDVHWGMGATVGSVIATKGAIIPAAVGVDIGCGMVAAKLTLMVASDLPDNLGAMRSAIEAAVPHGRTDNGGANDRGAWGNAPTRVYDAFFPPDSNDLPGSLYWRLTQICDKHSKLGRAAQKASKHLGTLGTGNHFIEVCLDEEQSVWVMLHSGSRGIGNAIGSYFIERAKADMRRWFINLPDADLAYLPEGSEGFNDYIEAVTWAQDFAATNRRLMLGNVISAIQATLGRDDVCAEVEAVNCHHNYVARENHFGQNVLVTRKGAVRAREGDLGIIPGSMGVQSYIVRGRGNPDSFNSCSHGAGRAMSRTAARKTFTLADHEAATAGVECRKDAEVLDETPGAYKSIDAVMEAQTDLVEVVHTLKQVLCVKG